MKISDWLVMGGDGYDCHEPMHYFKNESLVTVLSTLPNDFDMYDIIDLKALEEQQTIVKSKPKEPREVYFSNFSLTDEEIKELAEHGVSYNPKTYKVEILDQVAQLKSKLSKQELAAIKSSLENL